MASVTVFHPTSKTLAIICLWLLGLLFTLPISAHPLAPALLKIELESDTQAVVAWKESDLKPQRVQVGPVFPTDCIKTAEPKITQAQGAMRYQWAISCKSSLTGRQISIVGLENSRGNVLLSFVDTKHRSTSALLTSENNVFVVPATQESANRLKSYILKSYILAGIEHLLRGPDHLLFITGLYALLFRRMKTLMIAVTAFTLGHSLTLLLTRMGLLYFNSRWAEILVALSITALGLELLRNEKDTFSYSIRNAPYFLTFLFGLVHGCGFASALAEVLSQESSIALPVLGFNLGIEAGQCLVLIVLVVTRYLFQQWPWRNPKYFQYGVSYTLGTLSIYWLITRL